MTPSDHKELHQLGRFDRFMLWLLRAEGIRVLKQKRGNVNVSTVLRQFWSVLRNYPLRLTTVIIAAVVGSLASLCIPYVFKLFLDALNGTTGGRFGDFEPVTYIWLMLAIGLLHWFAWRVNYLIVGIIASRVMAELKQKAFSYLIDHSHHFFISTFTGSLVQKVNRYARAYDSLADRVVYDIIPLAITITGTSIVLYHERPILAYVIMLWLVVFLVWNYTFALWKVKFDITRAQTDSQSTGYLADVLTNQAAVELHHSHHAERSGYANATDYQALVTRFSWNASSIIDGMQGLFVVIFQVLVFFICLSLWKEGTVTIGVFVLVQGYLLQLSSNLWSFSRVIRDIYESFADAKEMSEILETPHEIQEKEHPVVIDPATIRGQIAFEGLRFGIVGKDVAEGMNFTLMPGERVALVGQSGAGKSTLIKLLFRQYDPWEGRVTLDQVDLRDLALSSLRGAMSLVPQDPILFHRSLAENIRYGKPDATFEEVVAAAKRARCHDFISRLTHGYGTLVGERGIKLSGGERQRVAIARAFLRNAPILVLDEATSSLDSESESLIQDALDELMRGKTTIIIAHRLSTIQRMERIIVLDNGMIVEDGTHSQLLAQEGVYARLWSIQRGGFFGEESGATTENSASVVDE